MNKPEKKLSKEELQTKIRAHFRWMQKPGIGLRELEQALERREAAIRELKQRFGLMTVVDKQHEVSFWEATR